jgi:flagellar basal body L-ring protein FlgH
MKIINILSLVVFSLTLSSCANYINQMHKEFDRAEGAPPPAQRDKFALYRQNKMRQQRKPLINSENNPYVVPSVKRDYQPQNAPRKRYKANDLADNAGDGSLWSGVEGRNNFLFTENREKSNGDIILIKVAGKLKNEITAELKRAFPAPVKTKKKKGDEEKEEAPGKAPASTTAQAPAGDDKQVDASGDTIYDRISSVVVEEINKDHILIRGRKNVLYHNRKRVVEVQALVARRDVMDDDTVHSNRILESQVMVLR